MSDTDAADTLLVLRRGRQNRSKRTSSPASSNLCSPAPRTPRKRRASCGFERNIDYIEVDEKQERRRLQNRRAQQALRVRKEEYLQGLEVKVESQDRALAKLKEENGELRRRLQARKDSIETFAPVKQEPASDLMDVDTLHQLGHRAAIPSITSTPSFESIVFPPPVCAVPNEATVYPGSGQLPPCSPVAPCSAPAMTRDSDPFLTAFDESVSAEMVRHHRWSLPSIFSALSTSPCSPSPASFSITSHRPPSPSRPYSSLGDAFAGMTPRGHQLVPKDLRLPPHMSTSPIPFRPSAPPPYSPCERRLVAVDGALNSLDDGQALAAWTQGWSPTPPM